jgi:hypothetical protein
MHSLPAGLVRFQQGFNCNQKKMAGWNPVQVESNYYPDLPVLVVL